LDHFLKKEIPIQHAYRLSLVCGDIKKFNAERDKLYRKLFTDHALKNEDGENVNDAGEVLKNGMMILDPDKKKMEKFKAEEEKLNSCENTIKFEPISLSKLSKEESNKMDMTVNCMIALKDFFVE